MLHILITSLTLIKPCLYAECYLAEAKNFPVQFDKYGSMYINGVKKKDFELEYRKSHKILRQYEKVGNIDGIKYELFKLQAMVDAIDIKLKKKDDKELRDTRARIINDLDHLMEIAMKLDPKFNFSKEYERSEFYDKNIRINNQAFDVDRFCNKYAINNQDIYGKGIGTYRIIDKNEDECTITIISIMEK